MEPIGLSPVGLAAAARWCGTMSDHIPLPT